MAANGSGFPPHAKARQNQKRSRLNFESGFQTGGQSRELAVPAAIATSFNPCDSINRENALAATLALVFLLRHFVAIIICFEKDGADGERNENMLST
jgi:hypothetical protein